MTRPALLRALPILLLFAPLFAKGAEPVTWMTYDTPPQYIFSGPLAGQGYKDRQLAFLMAHLPRFQHRVVKGSVRRAWYEISHRDGVCTLGMVPNKARRAEAILSDRAVLVPGFHLAVAANRVYKFSPYLDRDGEVDLALLAGSHQLTGAYAAGRVHAKAIEDFIGRTGRAVPLQQILDPRQRYSLVQMGRIDFTFGGPHEIRYFQRILDGGAAFAALPIRGVPRLVKTYLSCSNRPVGAAVVAAVDGMLLDDRLWEEFMAPLGDWMSETDMASALAVQPER